MLRRRATDGVGSDRREAVTGAAPTEASGGTDDGVDGTGSPQSEEVLLTTQVCQPYGPPPVLDAF